MLNEEQRIRRRILNKAVKEPDFSKFVSNLELDIFSDDENYSEVFSSLRDYYREHKEPASKDLLETYLSRKLDRKNVPETDREPLYQTVNDIYTVDESDSKVFDELITSYIEERRTKNAIMVLASKDVTSKAIDDFEDSFKKIKKDANKSGLHELIDFNDSDNDSKISSYIDEIKKGVLPIPLQPYQEATGGLAKGEMGIIAASSGQGKSQAMVSMAVEYSLSGNNVLYIDLEELTGRKFLRYYKAMMGKFGNVFNIPDETLIKYISINDASNTINTGRLTAMREKYTKITGNEVGNLVFTKYAPHTLTLSGLRQVVEDAVMVRGYDIDVIFIDYPDLLKYDVGSSESMAGGLVFEEMRAIGQDYNAIMWTASQLNRSSSQNEIKTGDSLEGSFRKKNAAEFLGVINVTKDEYESGYGRIFVDKSRNLANANSLVNFKVDKLTGLVRGETEREKFDHEALLNDRESTFGKKTVEDSGLNQFRESDSKSLEGMF